MGGKYRIARQIVDVILSDEAPTDHWFEPFVGGGNVLEKAVPHFMTCVAADAHPDLILMWSALAAGWRPEPVDRDMYRALRRADPSAQRGFVGFGASFGGRWFEGFGVSPRNGELWRTSARVVDRQGSLFAGVRFEHSDFGSIRPPAGSTLYCDPPYPGTKTYATSLDPGVFAKHLTEWSSDCHVYVSGTHPPDGVTCLTIWSRDVARSVNSRDNEVRVVENLYRVI